MEMEDEDLEFTMAMMTMRDEEFEFDQNRHPLKNDLVLDQIFSYITETKTLKACRTVSRIWHERATKQFEKNHCSINLGSVRRATQFAKTMYESWYPPYSSFIIAKTYIPRFANQFKRFSNIVKHLQLVSMKNSNQFNFANAINIIRETRNLEILEISGKSFPVGNVQPDGFVQFEIPNLKEINIKLTQERFEDGTIENADVVLWRLFHAAPQLHTLRFEVSHRILLERFLAATQSIQTLKFLEFNSRFREEVHLQFLTPAAWNLLSLKLDINLNDCRLIERLLESQANTLEYLDLCVVYTERQALPSMTFPIFPRLKKFKFISKFIFKQTLPLRTHYSSNGKIHLPALKSLWISENILRYFARKDILAPEVEELICEVTDYDNGSYEPFRCLNTYFPKLKKLTMKKANFYQIRSVFETAKYLEELCIDTFAFADSDSIDVLVTGTLRPEWLVDRLTKLNRKDWLVEYSFPRNDEASFNLMGFSNLKRFEVFNKQNRGVTSAVGLLGMSPLEHLFLYNTTIYTRCIAELKTRHKTVTAEKLTSKERDAIREKKFALF